MKNKLISFLNTYKFCFLAGLLIALIYPILKACFKGVVLHDNGLFVITVSDEYMLLGWPLLSALFGALSFIFLKKVFIPSLVFSITAWLGYEAFICCSFRLTFIVALLGFISTFVFSFASALITKFFAWLIRESKKAWTE